MVNEPNLPARLRVFLEDMDRFIEIQEEFLDGATSDVEIAFTKGILTGFRLLRKDLRDLL